MVWWPRKGYFGPLTSLKAPKGNRRDEDRSVRGTVREHTIRDEDVGGLVERIEARRPAAGEDRLGNSPLVAVVVLHWRGWEHTVECLQSLRGITYPNCRVIVVNNGSDRQDADQLRHWLGTAELLENKENLGFAGGNNAGIRYALKDPQVEYVVILNNDTVVEPRFLAETVETARSEKVDMVSPKVLAYSDRRTVDRLGIVISKALLCYDMKRWEGKEPFCPSGCAALYSRRLLEDVEVNGEYFDEDFFAYAEDVDLGIRAFLRGYRAALAGNAIVYHKGSASTGVQNPFPLYHGHRNTVWYLVKSVPASTWIRHLFWILAGQLLVAVSSTRRGYGLLVLKAKLAGLCGVPKMLRKRYRIQRAHEIDVQAFENALDHRPFYLFALRAVRYLINRVRVRSPMLARFLEWYADGL